MAMIKTTFVPQFKGEDVVLCSMDEQGLNLLQKAIQAVGATKTISKHVIGDEHHEVQLEGDSIFIKLDKDKVKWQISEAMLPDILGKMTGLIEGNGPGHQYVDIKGPTNTLILSKNEYV